VSDQVRYDAFISYRHCSPDKEIAENLRTDDPVIALSDYQNYMITPLSYEDVIKRADEEPAGYTPDVKFSEKYGLN